MWIRQCAAAMLSLVAPFVFAETLAAGTPVSFVTCPIVQDTSTNPCWFAEFQGERFYLGIQLDVSADWFPPQLKHQVLVEGVITDKKLCGARVIEPPFASVLPELDLSCNTFLPKVDGIEAPPAERGPGPATQPRNRDATPALPQPPFKPQTFTVLFDFDRSYLVRLQYYNILKAVDLAKASKAKEIDVIGYRATSLLSNGERLIEKPHLPEARAKAVEEWLYAAGTPKSTKVNVTWRAQAEPGNGVDDALRRRVEIKVSP